MVFHFRLRGKDMLFRKDLCLKFFNNYQVNNVIQKPA